MTPPCSESPSSGPSPSTPMTRTVASREHPSSTSRSRLTKHSPWSPGYARKVTSLRRRRTRYSTLPALITTMDARTGRMVLLAICPVFQLHTKTSWTIPRRTPASTSPSQVQGTLGRKCIVPFTTLPTIPVGSVAQPTNPPSTCANPHMTII